MRRQRAATYYVFSFEKRQERGEKRGREDRGVTEAAAGDRWNERMNREPDSHAQLSAGSKRERLTPGQRDMERERETGRGGGMTER